MQLLAYVSSDTTAYIFLVADPSNSVRELNETNNVSVPTQVLILPTATLQVVVNSPNTISELSGHTTGTVTRLHAADIASDLTVQLSTNGKAAVPQTVTIPATQTSATFSIDGVDNSLLDGTVPVTVTATATGYVAGSGVVDVTDYETLAVVVDPTTSPPKSVPENSQVITATVTRSNTGNMGSPLLVNLASSDVRWQRSRRR